MTRFLVQDVPTAPGRWIDAPHGETLAGMVARSGIRDGFARVTVVGEKRAYVPPRERWGQMHPREGATVVIRAVPQFEALLLPFATLGGSLVTSLYVATGISISVGFAGYAAIGAAAYGLSVSALANSLTPPLPQFGSRDVQNQYALDGWQNSVQKGEPLPAPAGKIRFSPPYLIPPTPEVDENGNLVQRAEFGCGVGPIKIDDVKIGETPVADFEDLTVETREGRATDTAMTINTVQTTTFNWNATPLGEPDPDVIYQTWTTPPNTDRARVIFNFPRGLVKVNGVDDLDETQMEIAVEFRVANSSAAWTPISSRADGVNYDFREIGKTEKAFFRQVAFSFPSRGRYEVRIGRITTLPQTTTRQNETHLAFCVAIADRKPYDFGVPVAAIAMKAVSSDRFSGTLQAVNCVATPYIRSWNSVTEVWDDDVASTNPADIAVHEITSNRCAYPESDANVIFEEWQDFAEFCDDKSLTFGRLFTSENRGERLTMICAAGRGSWTRRGAGYGVTIDQPKEKVDRLSPASASQFSWERTFVEKPHAYRTKFRDETNDYTEAERIVANPDHVGAITLYEQIPQEGVTDPAQIATALYRRHQEAKYRADRITVHQPAPLMVIDRGDHIGLAWPMLDERKVGARVQQVDGSVVVLDTPVTMVDGETYALTWNNWSTSDPTGVNVVAPVTTVPGETQALLIGSDAAAPEVGKKVHFGPSTDVEYDAFVLSVEPTQDNGFRLTLTNSAPEIDTLTDAYTPPAWEIGAGVDVATGGTPDTPVIGTIEAAAPEYVYTASGDLTVNVPVSETDTVPVASITVHHKLSSASTFENVTVTGNAGTAVLSYARDAVINVYAVSTSVFGDQSAASATQNFTVTGAEVALPTALDDDTMSVVGGLGNAAITFTTASDTAQVQLFRVPDGDTLDTATDAAGVPVTVSANTTVTLVDGDATRFNLLSNGDFATTSNWTAGGGWSIAAGVATHTAGSASTLSQALSLTDGDTYRIAVTVSGRTAGTVTPRLGGATPVDGSALSANGQALLALDANSTSDSFALVASSDFDGSVDDVTVYRQTAATAPAGTFVYHVAPITAERVATAPTQAGTATII